MSVEAGEVEVVGAACDAEDFACFHLEASDAVEGDFDGFYVLAEVLNLDVALGHEDDGAVGDGVCGDGGEDDGVDLRGEGCICNIKLRGLCTAPLFACGTCCKSTQFGY